MTQPTFYNQGVSPAFDLNDPGTAVLLGHTGTLRTTGEGDGKIDTVVPRGPGAGDDVRIGADTSAAAINPYLDPTLNPASLPAGTVAGPTYTSPIY